MTARFSTIALTAIALIFAAQADTLRLRNGTSINGTFLGGTTNEVRFGVDDRVQRYPRADVLSVEFNSDSEPASDDRGSERPRIDTPPPAPPRPAETNVSNVPFLRGAAGSLLSLERTYAQPMRGGGMMGMGGTVYRIPGPQSPVRVNRDDKIVFVLRGEPRRFQLSPLDSRMNYRETQGSMGMGAGPSIPVNINKISDTTYEITPARALYPGEYSFGPIGSNETYCFGVGY